MADAATAEPRPDDITIVTGLEGAVDPTEPVTCRYCRHNIVEDDDHSVICPWRRGKAVVPR